MALQTQQKAFTSLVQQHQALIHKVCHFYCNSPEDKKDLFQEIVYQLWRSFDSFRGEAKFTTWLYRIALNTALTFVRKNKLNRAITFMDADLIGIPQDNRAQELREQDDQLNRAIARLSDVEKSLVMLYLEERSYEEMEDILGINQNNLRVKMNRIKEKLKTLTHTPTRYGS